MDGVGLEIVCETLRRWRHTQLTSDRSALEMKKLHRYKWAASSQPPFCGVSLTLKNLFSIAKD